MLYLAPLEGITGYIYRNAYQKYFGGIDRYFTPFIAPAKGKPFRHRELEDVRPEHNTGITVIPQILTNHSEGFIKAAKALADMGYDEININMGCPSGTVVSKGKGSGMLADPVKLDHFLEEIFAADICKISVKTRLGMEFADEFPDILDVLMKYPFTEVIIHPRTREDYYGGCVDLSMFDLAVERYGEQTESVLCYNGDIADAAGYKNIQERYPQVDKIMIGRGIIGNPFLPQEIAEQRCCYNAGILLAFHDELFAGYMEAGLGARNVMFKMKELWSFMERLFEASDQQKILKKIRKANDPDTYNTEVRKLLQT